MLPKKTGLLIVTGGSSSTSGSGWYYCSTSSTVVGTAVPYTSRSTSSRGSSSRQW